MAPSITVVIPTKNRAGLLREAIESVLRSPAVNDPQLVLVLDDDSTDETPATAAEYGVRYRRINKASASGARNAGLELVDTPYVAFLDDDDIWLEGNMVPQCAALERHTDAAFAYGRFQMADSHLRPYGPPHPNCALPSGSIVNFLYFYEIQLGTVLFRTSAIREVGGFEESIRHDEDQDLLLRLTHSRTAIGVEFTGALFRQRQPSVAEGLARIESVRAHWRRMRRNRKLGVNPSLYVVLLSQWKYRGRWTWSLCEDSSVAITNRNYDAALQSLIAAIKLSPFHALLRNSSFWSSAARLVIDKASITHAR